MQLSDTANNYPIKLTREIWQSRAGHNLTDEDAREITENVTGFFSILARWSRAEAYTKASGVGEPTSESWEVCNER